jgi:hypothetical protein
MPTSSRDGDALIAALREVYEAVYAAVESFEDEDGVGADLAYLMGAMLRGTTCSWPAGRALLRILRPALPAGHPVWEHVTVEEGSQSPA